MNILSIDLGKFKSLACVYNSNTSEHRFTKLDTSPSAVHDLLVDVDPERVVIEVGSRRAGFKTCVKCCRSRSKWRTRRTKRGDGRTSRARPTGTTPCD